MKTDELVAMLASGAQAVPGHQAQRRYAAALAWGVAGALPLMAVLLGVRVDLAAAAGDAMFWAKLAFVVALVATSLPAALRLSTPGWRMAWVPVALAAPLVSMWLLAAVEMVQADPEQRAVLFFGQTAGSCPLLIALLSTPLLAALIRAMRGLAPTRLRLAGASAGFLAGACGALVYSLHCPESAAAFIGFWYPLGMLIPTAVGAALGPRLLRW